MRAFACHCTYSHSYSFIYLFNVNYAHINIIQATYNGVVGQKVDRLGEGSEVAFLQQMQKISNRIQTYSCKFQTNFYCGPKFYKMGVLAPNFAP